MFKEISAEQAKKLLTNKQIVLLDVRTKDEYQEQHLDHSINIDIHSDDFEAKVKKLDKEKIYLVFCRSGNRSSAASEIMKRLGFKDVICVIGWIFD